MKTLSKELKMVHKKETLCHFTMILCRVLFTPLYTLISLSCSTLLIHIIFLHALVLLMFPCCPQGLSFPSSELHTNEVFTDPWIGLFLIQI